jgi:hypothetical protein
MPYPIRRQEQDNVNLRFTATRAVTRICSASVPGKNCGTEGWRVLRPGVVRMGKIHVRRFFPELLKCIEDRKLHLEFVISHRMQVDEAATGTVCPAKKMMIAARSCRRHRYSQVRQARVYCARHCCSMEEASHGTFGTPKRKIRRPRRGSATRFLAGSVGHVKVS